MPSPDLPISKFPVWMQARFVISVQWFCHLHTNPLISYSASKKLPVMLWFIQVQIGRLILQWVFLKEQWLFHSWYPYAYSRQASASATAAVAHCQASQYMPIQAATLTLTLKLGVGMPLPHLYAKFNFNAAMKFFICAMNGIWQS